MATLVDTLLVALKLDMSGFASDANKAIKALDDLDKKADGASTTVVKLSDGTDKAAGSSKDLNQSNQSLTKSTEIVGKTTKNTSNVVLSFSDKLSDASDKTQDMSKSVNGAVKALAGLFTTIFVSSGLAKLVSEISSSNDQLHFLSKNLGMNADTIKKWQNVAEMSGGSADGMAATMTNLNKSLWDLVTVGDASILPFFNALGIGVVDSYGKIRNLDDILLDMADSMSRMERPQAYNIAKNMGLDDGTINMLLEGKEAVQKKLDAQKNLVISTKEELELNRKLREQNSVLSQQWEGLKTIVANYLIPRLLKLSTMVTGFLEYLNKNRETALNVFKLLSVFLTLTLIPVLFRVGRMLLLAFAPLIGTTGIILALAAALWVLYDDYQTWKKGGDSLFDWTEWSDSIEYILKKLDEFKKWFKDTTIGQWFKNTDGEISNLKLAFGAFATYIATKWVGKILGAFGKVSRGAKNIKAPGGKLGVVGKAGAVGLAAGVAYESEEYIDSALNSAFGEYDWFQRVRTAPTWSDFGNALIGKGDAKWVDGKWVDNRGKEVTPDIQNSKKDAQGNVNWLGVGMGILSSVSKTLDAAISVVVPNQMKRIYKMPTGELIKEGGSRSYRNNNPGNITWGSYARSMGAIGHDEETAGHIMAIFPDVETGRNAKRKLVFEDSKYKNLTLDEAIKVYAPEYDKNGKKINNTPQYIKNVLAAVGGKNKRMSEYNAEEQNRILDAMRNTEGWKEGKTTFIPKDPMLASNMGIKSYNINAANDFLSQTQRIQSMPVAGTTNNIKVDLNGDINVTTTANTVTGTVTDAGEAARLSLSQIMPTMS